MKWSAKGMSSSTIGKSPNRLDAFAKVTGKAKYAGDFFEGKMLTAKILRSPYAHARVRSIDTSCAKALPGVEAVLTYRDVPQVRYATAGHPYSIDPKYRDVEDRMVLTKKARFVGDEIAAVVAQDVLTAQRAIELINVEYEILEPLLTTDAALQQNAPLIHENKENNIVASHGYEIGDMEETLRNADYVFEDMFETSIVQHCQMENHVSYAYIDENERVVIVSSTQIPHVCRRIVGQALGIPWSKIRIIKPYVGGGFGSKQDVFLEPLNALLTMAVNGKPVKIELSREECMIATCTRHAFKYRLKTAVSKDGRLTGIQIQAVSNTGAYASHGHTISLSAGTKIRPLYSFDTMKFSPLTVYTNLPVAGAMRAYGVPQINFALESHLDNIAKELSMDSVELRRRNFLGSGYVDPINGLKVITCEIEQCVNKGKELIKWDEKKLAYTNQPEYLRRGLGMACFSYFSGTYPASLELAGARIVLNQDGSIQLQIGATEIGQGSDTVFAQMAAQELGIPLHMVHVISTQDTDVSPFDTGAYASRQTYITGMAVKKAASKVKEQILAFVYSMTDTPARELEIVEANIVIKNSQEAILSLSEVALHSFYDRVHAKPITSDTSTNAKTNAVAFGATFVEVEVDMKTGKIEILEIYNVHDSGIIINPKLAEGQVHGGVSMGIGYGLFEQMLFDEKTGEPLNNNFLDYKLLTIMDTPDINVSFIEVHDPTGPFGNKSLGEPPTITQAPAIRNAVLDATGVAFNSIPITPQKAFERFKELGLI